MTANKESEQLENLTNIQPNNFIIHKIKWFGYILEFLMIFLAVFLGFIAENIRENNAERETEIQYMLSLINDLKTDVLNIESFQKQILLTKQSGDSLHHLLTLPYYTNNTNSIYYFGRLFSARNYFSMTDGTLKQLTNAGGLRLIKKKNIIDSIHAYQYINLQVNKAQELKELLLDNYRGYAGKVFDVRIFETMVKETVITRPIGNPALNSQNKELINELLMKAHFAKKTNALIILLLNQMKCKSLNLQNIIKKEYKID